MPHQRFQRSDFISGVIPVYLSDESQGIYVCISCIGIETPVLRRSLIPFPVTPVVQRLLKQAGLSAGSSSVVPTSEPHFSETQERH